MSGSLLPDGLLLSWYGDDFTGSAAVMEALSFGGLDAVLFLDAPTQEQLREFAHCRAIGIAGVARSQTPEWMDQNLPAVFRTLEALNAPIAHYKICSTLDSSPTMGSIGHALDLAAPVLGGKWHPMLVAAPPIARYQAFGNLFATVDGATHRLDRHPVMSRHPVTPMGEADVRLHLSKQTTKEVGLIDLLSLRAENGGKKKLAEQIASGSKVVALDAIDQPDLVAAGRLIWEERGERLLAIGSQGVEYALLAYWRALGALPPAPEQVGAGRVDQIIVVSGSVSETTANQIAWSEQNGFTAVPFDAASVVDEVALAAACEATIASAAGILSSGRSVLVHSARGPGDPAVEVFRRAVGSASMPLTRANEMVGAALGRILDRLIQSTGLSRAVISGGDTSGHAALQLRLHALTALAPTIPGAALYQAHAEGRPKLQLALKGGQMGSPDYFGWVREGGGPRRPDMSQQRSFDHA